MNIFKLLSLTIILVNTVPVFSHTNKCKKNDPDCHKKGVVKTVTTPAVNLADDVINVFVPNNRE